MAGSINSLIIENVRCFAGRHEVPLAPLTILVGENSTGKSTFLALCRLAWDALFGSGSLDFNAEPFALGAYNEIAHHRGPRSGPEKIFSLGLGLRSANQQVARRGAAHAPADVGAWCADFENQASQPSVVRVSFERSPHRASLERRKSDLFLSVKMRTSNAGIALEREHWVYDQPGVVSPIARFMSAIGQAHNSFSPLGDVPVEYMQLLHVVGQFRDPPPSWSKRPYAVAPIRTKPERTYHPGSFEMRPEGGHVPMVLNRASALDPGRWKKLLSSLDGFGKACGLFQNISVRKLGGGESDPFQVQIQTGGPPFNLVDVGYGVSQVLPILVDALIGDGSCPILLQQPEVHLHPRAQAQLGSFLARIARIRGTQFIVETHSDHFVDRVRMDIRDGKGLSAEDVCLLFFERTKGNVEIHRIGIDANGNVDAPPGYRQFFLEEELRHLGH